MVGAEVLDKVNLVDMLPGGVELTIVTESRGCRLDQDALPVLGGSIEDLVFNRLLVVVLLVYLVSAKVRLAVLLVVLALVEHGQVA